MYRPPLGLVGGLTTTAGSLTTSLAASNSSGVSSIGASCYRARRTWINRQYSSSIQIIAKARVYVHATERARARTHRLLLVCPTGRGFQKCLLVRRNLALFLCRRRVERRRLPARDGFQRRRRHVSSHERDFDDDDDDDVSVSVSVSVVSDCEEPTRWFKVSC